MIAKFMLNQNFKDSKSFAWDHYRLISCFNIIGIWICIKLTPLLMLVLLIEKPKFPDVGDTEATSFVLIALAVGNM